MMSWAHCEMATPKTLTQQWGTPFCQTTIVPVFLSLLVTALLFVRLSLL